MSDPASLGAHSSSKDCANIAQKPLVSGSEMTEENVAQGRAPAKDCASWTPLDGEPLETCTMAGLNGIDHQASLNNPKYHYKGVQCVANCAAAVAQSHHIELARWSRAYGFKYILENGDRYYGQSWSEKHPNNNDYKFIFTDDLKEDSILFDVETKITCIKGPIKGQSALYGVFQKSLQDHLAFLFARCNYGIVIADDRARAVIKQKSKFYLFDPHGINTKGELLDVGGRATIFSFTTVEKLSEMLFNMINRRCCNPCDEKCDQREDDLLQYTIDPIRVRFPSKPERNDTEHEYELDADDYSEYMLSYFFGKEFQDLARSGDPAIAGPSSSCAAGPSKKSDDSAVLPSASESRKIEEESTPGQSQEANDPADAVQVIYPPTPFGPNHPNATFQNWKDSTKTVVDDVEAETPDGSSCEITYGPSWIYENSRVHNPFPFAEWLDKYTSPTNGAHYNLYRWENQTFETNAIPVKEIVFVMNLVDAKLRHHNVPVPAPVRPYEDFEDYSDLVPILQMRLAQLYIVQQQLLVNANQLAEQIQPINQATDVPADVNEKVIEDVLAENQHAQVGEFPEQYIPARVVLETEPNQINVESKHGIPNETDKNTRHVADVNEAADPNLETLDLPPTLQPAIGVTNEPSGSKKRQEDLTDEPAPDQEIQDREIEDAAGRVANDPNSKDGVVSPAHVRGQIHDLVAIDNQSSDEDHLSDIDIASIVVPPMLRQEPQRLTTTIELSTEADDETPDVSATEELSNVSNETQLAAVTVQATVHLDTNTVDPNSAGSLSVRVTFPPTLEPSIGENNEPSGSQKRPVALTDEATLDRMSKRARSAASVALDGDNLFSIPQLVAQPMDGPVPSVLLSAPLYAVQVLDNAADLIGDVQVNPEHQHEIPDTIAANDNGPSIANLPTDEDIRSIYVPVQWLRDPKASVNAEAIVITGTNIFSTNLTGSLPVVEHSTGGNEPQLLSVRASSLAQVMADHPNVEQPPQLEQGEDEQVEELLRLDFQQHVRELNVRITNRRDPAQLAGAEEQNVSVPRPPLLLTSPSFSDVETTGGNVPQVSNVGQSTQSVTQTERLTWQEKLACRFGQHLPSMRSRVGEEHLDTSPGNIFNSILELTNDEFATYSDLNGVESENFLFNMHMKRGFSQAADGRMNVEQFRRWQDRFRGSGLNFVGFRGYRPAEWFFEHGEGKWKFITYDVFMTRQLP